MVFSIYAIKLTHNKFFVGSTTNINFSLKYIFKKQKKKEKWLQIYKPLYVDKIFETNDISDEYKMLMRYIDKYGPDNVWGPTYDSIVRELLILQNRL